MQILIAFVVMGLIGVFAVVLAASAALIQCLPLVIVVLAVVGAVRWWERRSHPRNPPLPSTPPRVPAVSRPEPPPRPALPRPDGWVVVPVWLDRSGGVRRRPVIDAEVISVDEDHG